MCPCPTLVPTALFLLRGFTVLLVGVSLSLSGLLGNLSLFELKESLHTKASKILAALTLSTSSTFLCTVSSPCILTAKLCICQRTRKRTAGLICYCICHSPSLDLLAPTLRSLGSILNHKLRLVLEIFKPLLRNPPLWFDAFSQDIFTGHVHLPACVQCQCATIEAIGFTQLSTMSCKSTRPKINPSHSSISFFKIQHWKVWQANVGKMLALYKTLQKCRLARNTHCVHCHFAAEHRRYLASRSFDETSVEHSRQSCRRDRPCEGTDSARLQVVPYSGTANKLCKQ